MKIPEAESERRREPHLHGVSFLKIHADSYGEVGWVPTPCSGAATHLLGQ